MSWLLLGGKCASCGSRISLRYPLIELLTGTFAVLSVNTFGYTPTALLIFIAVCTFIVITFIDFDYYVIPDEISIRGSILALIVGLGNYWFPTFEAPVVRYPIDSVLGMLCGAGLLYLIFLLYYLVRRREGMGLGDVKLLLLIGALFGVYSVIYTIFISALLGSIVGVLLIAFKGKKMSSAIPFGPYITIAATLYLFTGFTLLQWIIDLLEVAPS